MTRWVTAREDIVYQKRVHKSETAEADTRTCDLHSERFKHLVFSSGRGPTSDSPAIRRFLRAAM